MNINYITPSNTEFILSVNLNNVILTTNVKQQGHCDRNPP